VSRRFVIIAYLLQAARPAHLIFDLDILVIFGVDINHEDPHCVIFSARSKQTIIIIIIIIIICNWVVTRWQWLFYMYTNMKKKSN